VQTVVELACELFSRDADRGQQVRAANVANEERVAGQYGVWLVIVGMFPHDDADRLGRVPGRVANLEDDVAEFEVAGQEVRVEVCFDDQFDGETRCGSIADVFSDVRARVDNDSSAACLITKEVRSLRGSRGSTA
jgi:hypothetical protein